MLCKDNDDLCRQENILDYLKQLTTLGLSNNQALIYLNLVQNGQLRINQISHSCHIPRSTVYQDLKKLFQLGLAEEIINETYKSIRPYPISNLKSDIEDKIEKLDRQCQTINELEDRLKLNNNLEFPVNTKVRFYSGRSGARQMFWNSLHANNNVYVYSEWGRSMFLGVKFYRNFVEESKKRQVSEKVLVNSDPKIIQTIINGLNEPTSRTPLKYIYSITKEIKPIKGETLIYNNTFAQVYINDSVIEGFEIENSNFVESQRSFFEYLLRKSTKITKSAASNWT